LFTQGSYKAFTRLVDNVLQGFEICVCKVFYTVVIFKGFLPGLEQVITRLLPGFYKAFTRRLQSF
jgi:hypothetical protein